MDNVQNADSYNRLRYEEKREMFEKKSKTSDLFWHILTFQA
jgi:hypothetical protein